MYFGSEEHFPSEPFHMLRLLGGSWFCLLFANAFLAAWAPPSFILAGRAVDEWPVVALLPWLKITLWSKIEKQFQSKPHFTTVTDGLVSSFNIYFNL